jgi:nitrogen fixation NifU-like protein
MAAFMTFDMYSEIILDYYRNPRNFGKIEKADFSAEDANPLCGDKISIQAKVTKGKIDEILFSGKGCAISQASASMLTEMAKGKSVEEVAKMSKQELLDTLGISLSAVRLKCALLSFKVLKMGVFNFLGQKLEEEIYED